MAPSKTSTALVRSLGHSHSCFAFVVIWSLLVSSIRNSHGFVYQNPCTRRRNRSGTVSTAGRPDLFSAFMVTSNKENGRHLNEPKSTKKPQGVYARPSAAIERGSGFFVPGLEGPKVRLAAGIVLLGLVVVNHHNGGLSVTENVPIADDGSSSSTAAAQVAANVFSESLAAIFSLFVLFQGAIEYTKERKGLVEIGNVTGKRSKRQGQGVSTTTREGAAGGGVSYQQQWSFPMDDDWRSRVEWSGRTYLSLTPATHLLLLGPGKILYWLGITKQPAGGTIEEEACLAALSTLDKSVSGRVALPDRHPAVKLVFAGDDDDEEEKTPVRIPRCVVLQRIGDADQQLCWLMASTEQLLAGFTRRDLQWLGQLALYVKPPS